MSGEEERRRLCLGEYVALGVYTDMNETFGSTRGYAGLVELACEEGVSFGRDRGMGILRRGQGKEEKWLGYDDFYREL